MDQDDSDGTDGEPLMSTSPDLRELSRQSRARLTSADHLRAENRLICGQTARRMRESRALLDRAALRTQPQAPVRLEHPSAGGLTEHWSG